MSTSPSTSAASPAPSADDLAARPPRDGMCNPDGTLANSAIRTSKLGLHAYARLLGDVYRKDLVIAGDLAAPGGRPCSGDCLDIEDRAAGFEPALALAGAPVVMRRGAAIVSSHVKPVPSPVAGASPAVDFDLERGNGAELARIMGDISKRKVLGAPDGEITIFVRNRPALDVLALIADAAGTTTAPRGSDVAVAPGGELPPMTPSTQTLRPAGDAPRTSAWVMAESDPIESLRVAALISSPTGTVRAVLRAPAGPGWVVKVGDYIGKARTI
ncbi:MAG: hypothetical protein JNK04_12875, partial [Myxococcales bacterium]|nr:hypothetical protein [Myxococcales bacterium]